MQFFSTKCQGIRPHLAARGKFHVISRVASGTWDIFSRDGGDGPSKVVCVQQHQDYSLLARHRFGFSWKHGSAKGPLSRGVGGPRSLSTCHRDIGIPVNFQEESDIFKF